MTREGIREENNNTICRFLSGLNVEIKDRVERLPYKDLNDLIQLCIKVEQQILRKKGNKKQSSCYVPYDKGEFHMGESI